MSRSDVSQSVMSGTLTETNPMSTLTTVESWYTETTASLVEKAVLSWLRTEGERSEWSQILVRVGRALFPTFIEFATTFASLFIRRETNFAERTVALKQFASASRSIFTAHFDLCRNLLTVRDILSLPHSLSTRSYFCCVKNAPNALHVLAALQTQSVIFTQFHNDLTKLLGETIGGGGGGDNIQTTTQAASSKDTTPPISLTINIPDIAYNFTLSILTAYLEQHFAKAHSEIDSMLYLLLFDAYTTHTSFFFFTVPLTNDLV